MSRVDKRGEIVALFSGLLTAASAALLVVLAVWSQGRTVWGAALQTAGAAGVWLISLIQLHQLRLVAEEQLEIEDLERTRREKLGGARTVFEEDDLGQMEKLAMGRRLRTIERFLVPVLALLVSLFFAAGGLALLGWFTAWRPLDTLVESGVANPTIMVFFLLGLAFVTFMLSRYALGMSRLPEWTLLRAGGNYLFGASMVCLAGMVGMLFVMNGMPQVEVWVSQAIGVLMLLMAAETVLNFVLDFYRPRIEGQAQRPFYDSRLLGMFSEPGGIVQSLAKAIDYQFGFKVSETWFYKLLGRQLVPLLLVQAALVILLTTFTVVPPGHEAVIQRFALGGTAPAPITVGPGIHVTWPWPMARATVIPTERVQRMELGHEPHPQDAVPRRGQPVLWTKAHYVKEYKLIVAGKQVSGEAQAPINLLSLNMPVHWRVKPGQTLRFFRQSADAASLIESLGYRELTQYAAHTDMDDLMGAGGIGANETLRQRLQAACDAAGEDGGGLGVEIVYVGIGGIHPPPEEDVAKTYEEVINAYERRASLISRAEGEAASIQINTAGIEHDALYEAIVAEEQARESAAADLPERTARVEEMLRRLAGGMARQRTALAEQQTYARVFSERAAAERYSAQLAAYQAAPRTYLLRAYLGMLEEGLTQVQKYVIAVQDVHRVLLQCDLRPPTSIDLTGADAAALEKAEQ